MKKRHGETKRRYDRLAVMSRPELANFAKYPAVHWFTYFRLRAQINGHGRPEHHK